jgi:hypothetical protein
MKTIHTKIAGVSHKNDDGTSRQRYIRDYVSAGQHLILKREPRNKYSANATSVWWDQNIQLGYVPGDLSADVARLLDSGQNLVTVVHQVTGGVRGKPTLGVNIDIHVLADGESIPEPEKVGLLTALLRGLGL